MDLLLLLVNTNALVVHEQRYNRGKYRAMFYHPDIANIAVEELQGGDYEWSLFQHSIFQTDWFPYGDGETLAEAVKNLEDKVNGIPEELQDKFYNAYTVLMAYMLNHPDAPPSCMYGRENGQFDKLATLDIELFTNKLKEAQ